MGEKVVRKQISPETRNRKVIIIVGDEHRHKIERYGMRAQSHRHFRFSDAENTRDDRTPNGPLEPWRPFAMALPNSVIGKKRKTL